MTMNITIPNLGDIDEVEVIEICVSPGDVVAENDVIVVIESDKASMEIPAPAAGQITAMQVALGDQVKEGDVIGVMEVAGDAGEEEPSETARQAGQAVSDTLDAPAVDQQEAPVAAPAAETATTQVDVLVPDIGDATGVTVIEVAVKAGDHIEVNDLLVVLESDKASMEITAEQAGTVISVAVSEEQEVEEGTLIATIEVVGAAPVPDAQKTGQPEEPAAIPADGPVQPAPVDAGSSVSGHSTQTAAEGDSEAAARAAAKVYAGPAVRRLARELGVSLSGIQGSGNRNRITKDDVKAFVKARMQAGPGVTSAGSAWPTVPPVDFAKFGPVETVELSRIRRRGADNLHRSWVNLPHVTQHDEADITDLEAFRKSLKQEAERRGVKITPLAFLIKACCSALLEYPEFNSSLHEDQQQLIIKRYINIGMAVDTPEGLLVPVIKAAETKSIWELCARIAELSERARTKKLTMDDLQGGTFSISSLGALGGTGFTPIVNAPEVAILGVARLQTRPMWDGESFQPREMLPLSLSYDHRVINGVDGGRFMQHLTMLLSDIRRLAL